MKKKIMTAIAVAMIIAPISAYSVKGKWVYEVGSTDTDPDGCAGKGSDCTWGAAL